MNLPLIVEISIGLIFIYLIFSLLTSEIQELLTTLLQWRAVHLKESIEGLLAGSNESSQLKQARVLANKLYESPVINTLNQEAKGLGASLPRYLNQAIGKFVRDLLKRENVFGGQKSGPSFIALESFATSFLETLGIPGVIQKFTLLRMEEFNSRLINRLEEALQKASIAGVNQKTLDWELKTKEDEAKLKDSLITDFEINEPSQAIFLLYQFYNFKRKLNKTVIAFQNRGLDLAASVDRLEEVLIQYIESLEEYFQGTTSPPDDFIKNLKLIQFDTFGKTKTDSSRGAKDWSTEKSLLLRSLQPNLTEAVEILRGFWQLKRCWSAYKRVREGAAIDAVSHLTLTIDSYPSLSKSSKENLLNLLKQKTIGGADYGYDRIRDIFEHAKLKSYLQDVNIIIEETYHQIGELIQSQPDELLPQSVKTALLQKIDSEARKASISSLTYEFEKVRRGEVINFRQTSGETTSSEGINISHIDTFPRLNNKLEEIINITDEIIDSSYEKIQGKVIDKKSLSASKKQNILKEINEVTSRSLNFKYETLRKEIESQTGIPWSDKQILLKKVDEIVNGFLNDEYENFKKAIENQTNLNLSVKQSLLLLATAITLRKDSELARLVDRALGIGTLPESVERNLFLLAQQAEIKADGVKEELNQFRREVENWFDKSMERAEGVYKRNAKLVAILIGSLVAVAVNADTVHIVSRLTQDQILRSTLVKAADESITNTGLTSDCFTTNNNDAKCSEALKKFNRVTKTLSLPIGWGPENRKQQRQEVRSLGFLGFFRQVLGWFVSGVALSMGANFWYEMLGKFINVRNTGRVPPPPQKQANAENSKSIQY
jgi:hypothetical protein